MEQITINTIIVTFLIFFNVIGNTNSKLKCARKKESQSNIERGSERTLLGKTLQVPEIKKNNKSDRADNFNHEIRRRDLFDSINVFNIAALPDFLHTSTDVNGTVKLQLYTLKNKDEEQPIGFDTLLSETNWNPKEDAIFIIHGWLQAGQEDILQKVASAAKTSLNIKKAFMETNRTENIILVDWQMNSRQPNYFSAAKDVQIVGKALGDMIISLKSRKFLTFDQVTLVGFSLGGQIAGITGYQIRSKTNEKISRITGLDPAGPGFEATVSTNDRLDKSDAKFVEVIHCNAGYLVPFRQLGTTVISGHVDFYPNGGTTQPDCDAVDMVALSLCSHAKCPQLYASSVRGKVFKGCKCESLEKFEKGECTECSGPPMGYICPKK